MSATGTAAVQLGGDDLWDVSGRSVIVTGATRGLGRAMATGFAERGARVVISSRKQPACDEAASQLRERTGAEVVGVQAHGGDIDAVAALVDRTVEVFGGVDVVVNNAGISLGMNVGEITQGGIQKSLDVNLLGPLFLVQHALPYLEKSSGASVINILTSGTDRPGRGLAVYTVSKAALEMLTKAMAMELAVKGIRVNAISPGPFATDMLDNLEPARRAEVEAGIPLGRIADPAEIVGAAIFLASRASSFMTGSVVLLDGGQTIGI